jgi:hypothetical protein
VPKCRKEITTRCLITHKSAVLKILYFVTMLHRSQKLRCVFRRVHTETAKSEYWLLLVCQYTLLSVFLSVRLFTRITLTRVG